MRPLRIGLTPWESRRLRLWRRQGTTSRVGRRAMCLLASAAGQPAQTIARITGLSPDAITDIRRRWRKRRLASLIDRPRRGCPPRITPRYRRLLRAALRTSPLRFRYAFTLWSLARLGAHLQKKTGIRLGRTRLRELVHGERFVIGRPKRTLKGKRNEREFRRAQGKLHGLKKGPFCLKPTMSFGISMPASFPSTPISCGAG